VVSLLLMLHFELVIRLVTLLIVVSVMLRNRPRGTDPRGQQHYKTQGRRQGLLAESAAGITTVKARALEHSAGRTAERRHRCVHRGDAAAIRRGAHFNVSAFVVMRGINMIVLACGRSARLAA
jgi:ABC-type multidrug transport system fused ATPase/permease subunit